MARSRHLRLVSFNVLEGFRPLAKLGTERRLLDRQRVAAARAVVGELAPDILVLNEALFCRIHGGKKVDYQRLFGFPHEAAALYDGAWGNAILSRFPITRSREQRIYNRGGLIAVIATPGGALTVASYHPHPRRIPRNKALDFARLVEGLEGPLVVCGDLNCISPEDGVDREQLIRAFGEFSTTPAADVDRFLESGRLVFGALGNLGVRDAIPAAARRYSIPTDLISLDKSSGIRIDHILCNDKIAVLDGGVLHSRESNRASDHYPVFLDFRIAGAANEAARAAARCEDQV